MLTTEEKNLKSFLLYEEEEKIPIPFILLWWCGKSVIQCILLCVVYTVKVEHSLQFTGIVTHCLSTTPWGFTRRGFALIPYIYCQTGNWNFFLFLEYSGIYWESILFKISSKLERQKLVYFWNIYSKGLLNWVYSRKFAQFRLETDWCVHLSNGGIHSLPLPLPPKLFWNMCFGHFAVVYCSWNKSKGKGKSSSSEIFNKILIFSYNGNITIVHCVLVIMCFPLSF